MSPVTNRGGVEGVRFVRISIVGLLSLTLFIALAVRLFDLQVLDGAQLAAAAEANKVRTVFEEAPRGRILDRNGEVIVGNHDVDVLTVDREQVARDDTLLPRLAQFLSVDVSTLEARMQDSRSSLYRPVTVATGVDKAVIASFRERTSEFVGVTAATQVERWYPQGPVAAQAIGYVGEINEDELSSRNEDGYVLGDEIGKSGLEQAYEDVLRGRVGVDKIEVNSSGEAVRVLDRSAPVPGQDIRTSLDLKTQQAAEKSIAASLATARGGPDPKANPGTPAQAGAAVAIDPTNGMIRVMASYPSYDPAAFVNGISAAEYQALTADDSYLPLTNRAISGQYAPGSTFKLITAIAAVKAGLVTPETVIQDRGTFTLGNRSYRNAQGAVYGPVDLRRSISVSSDVYFYELGAQFWFQREKLGTPVQDVARSFGMGTRSGISLAGESAGRVPDAKNRAELHASNPTAFPNGNWYGGDDVNVAIGQGDTLATPLQLANVYATFANGGTVREPQLVEAILNADGTVAREFGPIEKGKVDLPASIRGPVQDGLIGAVQSQGGTGTSAFRGFDMAAFPIAGKTGTAQSTGKQDSALFTAYGPVGSPTIAMAIVMENAGFGGVVAAPVGRQMFAAASGQAEAPVALGTGVD